MMQLNELGNVRETMTWIITDNLFIDPSSATSVISVLKTLKAQVDVLEHKTIYFHISDLFTGSSWGNNLCQKCK
ncbi:hypothetical protein K7X08_009679 [Anisodus acutangulus]|uniref:Uncharacterized protein n=1 Tax=Anisodus acutangulus TaxID=402998 RepID=A0A9Q1N092_9SOLA|nr:hypothetical protein K7X08_009679 [Anisodus acutangulus]